MVERVGECLWLPWVVNGMDVDGANGFDCNRRQRLLSSVPTVTVAVSIGK